MGKNLSHPDKNHNKKQSPVKTTQTMAKGQKRKIVESTSSDYSESDSDFVSEKQQKKSKSLLEGGPSKPSKKRPSSSLKGVSKISKSKKIKTVIKVFFWS